MAASQPLIVLDVVKAIPYLDARPGDQLFLRPGHRDRPFLLVRELPDNYALTVLSDAKSTTATYVPSSPPPSSASRPPRRGQRRRRRLKLLPP